MVLHRGPDPDAARTGDHESGYNDGSHILSDAALTRFSDMDGWTAGDGPV